MHRTFHSGRLTGALVLFSILALGCERSDEGQSDLTGPALAIGDLTNDYNDIAPGIVQVCAFLGDGPDEIATFSASATGGDVIDGDFDIPWWPHCMESWNATDASTETFTATLVSSTPEWELERIVTMVSDGSGGQIVNNLLGTETAEVDVSEDIGAMIWFKLVPEDAPEGGGQGCTPGYWRQTQHFGSWTAPYSPYDPGTTFESVFGSSVFGSMTLLDVVWLKGGKENALGRHAVAALLNAASGDVDYDFTESEIIDAFNAALAGGKDAIENQKNVFDMLNNQGCGLGRAL